MRKFLNLGRRLRANSSRGFTLLELAVAILVLALGSLAAVRASDQSRRAIGGEIPRLMARIAARNRAGGIAAPGAHRPRLAGSDPAWRS